MLLNSLRPDAFDRQFLFEAADGRQDIIEAAEQIREAVIACSILLEQGGGTLTADQINQLFTNAQAISQGKKPGGGFLGKAAGAVKGAAGAVGNLMKVIQDSAKKLQNTEPVQNFDAKVSEILGKWKENLGDDHKAVKLAQTFGEYASKNPKKTAFAIAVLSGLTGAIATPGAGAAMGAALRGAVGLMKGEKASTVLAKAGIHAGIGGVAGAVGGMIAQSDTMQALADKVGLDKLKGLIGGGNASIEGASPEEVQHWTRTIRTYNSPRGGVAFIPDNIANIEKALGPEKGEQFMNAWKNWRENNHTEIHPNLGQYELADKAAREQLMVKAGVDPGQAKELAAEHPNVEETARKARFKQRREDLKHGLSGRARGGEGGDYRKLGRLMPRNVPSHLKGTSTGFGESFEFNFPRLDEAIMGKKGVSMQALQQAWQQAGSPMDLMSIYKVLKQSGLDDNQVKQAFTSVGVEWEDITMGGEPKKGQQQTQQGQAAGAPQIASGSWYARRPAQQGAREAVELARQRPDLVPQIRKLILQAYHAKKQEGGQQ